MRTLALVLAAGLGFGCNKSPTEKPQPVDRPAVAPAPTAKQVLAKAPAGQLTRTDHTQVALADELNKHAETIVVFYRGFY